MADAADLQLPIGSHPKNQDVSFTRSGKLAVVALVIGWVRRDLRLWMDTQRELLPVVLFATAMGFLVGWELEVTGNLLAPVLTHATANGLAFHYFLAAARNP